MHVSYGLCRMNQNFISTNCARSPTSRRFNPGIFPPWFVRRGAYTIILKKKHCETCLRIGKVQTNFLLSLELLRNNIRNRCRKNNEPVEDKTVHKAGGNI